MSQTSTLDAIGLKHGTDKASSLNNLLNFYEMFFSSLRDAPLTIFEIGVYKGGSLHTWEEYFPKAKIIGADILPTAKRFERGRLIIEVLDQSNVEELSRIGIKHGPFDIVIDDGAHMWGHQITALRTLLPFVKDNGIYIVEDLWTSYGPMTERYKGVASASTADFLKAWVDLRVSRTPRRDIEDAFLRTYQDGAQFISFCCRACLIKKQVPIIDRVKKQGAGRPLVALDTSGARTAVHIVAHLSHMGDVDGPSGFVNPGLDEFVFQGLSIGCREDILEYRVRGANGTWSDWSRSDKFLGTRAESKLLTGVTVRLAENARDRYRLRTLGRFVGSGNAIEVSDGEDCTSPSGEALCGIQIELTKQAH